MKKKQKTNKNPYNPKKIFQETLHCEATNKSNRFCSGGIVLTLCKKKKKILKSALLSAVYAVE